MIVIVVSVIVVVVIGGVLAVNSRDKKVENGQNAIYTSCMHTEDVSVGYNGEMRSKSGQGHEDAVQKCNEEAGIS